MKLLILAVFASLCLASSAMPTTIHVPVDRPTITSAMGTAINGDTILVAPGTYTENFSFVGKRVVLLSQAGRDMTTIRSNTSSSYIVSFAGGEDSLSVLDGFTIDGRGTTRGIQCQSTSPIIQNCQIQNCNSGQDGGGIYCIYSKAKIRNNIIHNNYCPATGGGICVERGPSSGNLEISENVFYDQTTGSAQGLGCLYTYNLYIHNNVFHGNMSPGWWASGGIYMNGGDGTVRIINNTFVNNTRGLVTFATPQPVFMNNIVVRSALDAVPSGMTNIDYNDIWSNGTNLSGGVHGFALDPRFIDTISYHLEASSPCVNAGNPNPAYNDPDGSQNDIGAFPIDLDVPYAGQLSFGVGSLDHIVSPTPTITWQFVDTLGGQTGYEIEVGTDSDWSTAELWSTGQVNSSTGSVDYDGAPLSPLNTYWLRIRVTDGLIWGPWLATWFRLDSPPGVPVPSSPVSATTRTTTTYLVTTNSSDPDGDIVTYDFEVALDSGFTSLVTSRTNIAQMTPMTHTDTLTGLAGGQTYYWRVRAFDGYLKTAFSAPVSFVPVSGNFTLHVPGGYSTIQMAVDASLYMDTVLVAPGVYPEAISLMGKGIYLKSEGGAAVTTLRSPASGGSVVSFKTGEDTTSILDGFTIDGLNQSRGIICLNSSPIIENCDIMACNSSSDGGGIYCEGSGARILHCKIHDNYVPATGGGICIRNGRGDRRLEVAYCEIYSHTSGSAEAIGCLGPSYVTIHHNVIRDNINDSWWSAAGLYMNEMGLDVVISNNTFYNNSRGFVKFGYGEVQPEFKANIVANSHISGIANGLVQSDYNDCWNNPTDSAPGPNGVTGNPFFVNAAANDFHIAPFSSCIDMGIPDPQYNDPDGTRSDIGAYWTTWHVPGDFGLIFPPDVAGSDVYSLLPTLTWQPAVDVDSGDVVTYKVEVSLNSTFTLLVALDSVTTTTYTVPDSLSHGIRYWWRVTAYDRNNHTVFCNQKKAFNVWVTGDLNHSHSVDLADLSTMVGYLTGSASFSPRMAGDINADCRVDLADLARFVAYLTGVSVKLLDGCAPEPAAKPATSATKK